MSDEMTTDTAGRYDFSEDGDPYIIKTQGGTFGGPSDKEDDGRFYFGGGSVMEDGTINPEHYAALPKELYDKGIVHPGQVFRVINPANNESAFVVARDVGPSAPHRGVDIAPHVGHMIGYETDKPLLLDMRPHGFAGSPDAAANGLKPVIVPHPNNGLGWGGGWGGDRHTAMMSMSQNVPQDEQDQTRASPDQEIPAGMEPDDMGQDTPGQDATEGEMGQVAAAQKPGITSLWNPGDQPEIDKRFSDGSVRLKNGVTVYGDHIERDIGGRRYAQYPGQRPVNVMPDTGMLKEVMKRDPKMLYDENGRPRSSGELTKMISDFDKQGMGAIDIEKLKRENPTEFSKAQALVEGRLPLSSYGLTRNPAMQKLIGEALAIDPDFDPTRYEERKMTRRQFASTTPTTAGGNVIALNTAIHHLKTLDDAAGRLDNQKLKIANTLDNYLKTQTGSPEVVAFNAAKQQVATEVARAFRGGVPTNMDITEWEKTLGAANSPDQLKQVIRQVLPDLLAGRLSELGGQWQDKMGKPPDTPLLRPGSAKILKEMGVDLTQFEPDTAKAASSVAAPDIKPATPSAPAPVKAAEAIAEAQRRLKEPLDPNDPKSVARHKLAQEALDAAKSMNLVP